MNSDRIVKELGAIARFLDMAYLPATATQVRSLLGCDLAGTSSSDWQVSIVETYRQEVVGSRNILGAPDPDHHRALLDGMDRVVLGAVGRPDAFLQFILTTRSLNEAIGDSHGNTRELYRSFLGSGTSRKHVYLNLCLMYLMLCEGVFTNQGRLLLACAAIADPTIGWQPVEALGLTPADVAVRLENIDLGAFTLGYNRHLRNAIAHGHVRYDEGSGAVRFRDYRLRPQVEVLFDEVWAFERFAQNYARMDDGYLIMSTYLQVHFLSLLRRL